MRSDGSSEARRALEPRRPRWWAVGEGVAIGASGTAIAASGVSGEGAAPPPTLGDASPSAVAVAAAAAPAAGLGGTDEQAELDFVYSRERLNPAVAQHAICRPLMPLRALSCVAMGLTPAASAVR